ncbi:MAG TPA: hypothetical protein VIR55_00595 [Ignavibacteria bacterium]
MSNESSKIINRINYIDQLRAWNVLLMCYTHSLDAMLSDEYKTGIFFKIIHFIEGIIAPSFLFVSGAAFAIVLHKRIDGYLNYGKPAQKQLLRLLFLLLIAYSLNLPYKTLNQCNTILTFEQYLLFIKSNNLHVIVFGIFFSQILFLIIRNEKKFHWVLFFLSILVVSVTPTIYQYDFGKVLPLPLATLINTKYLSAFPLFHWIAYYFIGAFVMFQLIRAIQENREEDLIKNLFFIAIFSSFIFTLLEIIGIETTSYYDFWLTSPNIFIIRLSSVLVLVCLFYYLETRFNYRMIVFNVFKSESLLVYVLHLMIIYGSVLAPGIDKIFGKTLNWAEIIGLGTIISATLLAIAYMWNWFKKNYKLHSRIFLTLIWLYFIYYFLTKPY